MSNDKCAVCEKNEPDVHFETCEECKDDLFEYLGDRLITYDRILAWAARRARENQQAEIDRLKELIYQAALASETVDHWEGTRELRREAGLKTA